MKPNRPLSILTQNATSSPFFKEGSRGIRLFLFLTIAFFSLPAVAQLSIQQINTELQRAANFESQKEFPSAIQIYRTLHTQYPKRGDILLRLESALSRTGQHAEAVTLLRKRLATAPNDIGTRLRLGQALFALNLPDSAVTHWDHILKKATTANPFALVADRYRKRNLDDYAKKTYHKARTALKDTTVFARELAELAERQTHYPEAVREYILYIQKTPQYRPMIEARLRDFAQNGDKHDEIYALLENKVRANIDDRVYLNLLIEYALPAQFASRVLELLLTMPKLPENGWIYLSRIARYALDTNDPTTSISAYQAMYNRVDRPDIRARALLGLGRAHELARRPIDAQTYYNSLIEHHPKRPETDEAHYRVGLILRDHQEAPKDAQKIFQALIKTNRRNTWRYKALFALAEGHLQINDLTKAKDAWQQILSERQNAQEGAEARFCLAEFRFLTGQMNTAQTLLDTLLKAETNRDIINDAIALFALIQEGQRTDSTLLATYAQARLKHRQNDSKTALTAFVNLYEANPESFLADRLLNHQAAIHESRAHYPQALQTHRKLIAKIPWSPLCPATQMALANIYDTHLKQYYEAQTAYETLLINYPLSLEADLARERLRTLQRKIQDLKNPKEAG
ncbi:MAG: tetratricopeptide repeat protein [Candidatus Latescibacteria bacterium]|nr:tetratricopeptide repeat protein [Candidatus Latescibacterota bacterium]